MIKRWITNFSAPQWHIKQAKNYELRSRISCKICCALYGVSLVLIFALQSQRELSFATSVRRQISQWPSLPFTWRQVGVSGEDPVKATYAAKPSPERFRLQILKTDRSSPRMWSFSGTPDLEAEATSEVPQRLEAGRPPPRPAKFSP